MQWCPVALWSEHLFAIKMAVNGVVWVGEFSNVVFVVAYKFKKLQEENAIRVPFVFMSREVRAIEQVWMNIEPRNYRLGINLCGSVDALFEILKWAFRWIRWIILIKRNYCNSGVYIGWLIEYLRQRSLSLSLTFQ